MPMHRIYSATSTTEIEATVDALGTKNVDIAETVSNNQFFKETKEWIVSHTPNFIKTAILSSVSALEKFRTGAFDSKFIFYPILFIVLFFFIRSVWDFFFY